MKKHPNNLLIAAAALCATMLLVMVISLQYGGKQTQGEFTPPPFAENAVQGTPNVSDGLGWRELDAQVYKVSLCGVFQPKENVADIWLTNPASNTIWMKLRVLDLEGNILGETGLIQPGEYLQSVCLDSVPPSGTAIQLKIMAYEPNTYYSAGALSINTTVQ